MCTCFYTHAVVDCESDPLTNPTNGIVTTFSGTTFMMMATYTCNPGYIVSGTTSNTATRTCQSNALWSGSVPVCDGELLISLVYDESNVLYRAVSS